MNELRIPSEPKPKPQIPKFLEEEPDKVKFELLDGEIKEFPIVEQDTTRANPPKNRLNPTVSLLLATILIALYVLLESQILNLPFTFRQYLLGPYLQVLHEWVLFVKHIYTFLKRAYPNNALTTSVEKIVLFVVDAIPDDSLKNYVKTAPQTVALRPHIKNALLEFLRSLQTPQNTLLITGLTNLSKSIEELSETGRMLKIDEATVSKINSTDAKYIDMLHIVNNYQTRFNQFMDYFIKLFNTILSTVTTLDLEKEDALFQSVSEMSRSALDFPAANIVSKLSETIPKLIEELDIILRAKFAEEESTIEEIDGGKRKTRRRKTLTLRKRKTLTLRKRKANKKQKKRRNTRIVHQKLDKLAKFFTFLQ
jgi:hypothetical protein